MENETNKAVEEGELPVVTPWTERMGVKSDDMVWPHEAWPYIKAEILDLRAAVAVDRSEVEPVAYLRWWARQIDEGHGNIGHEEGYEVCKKGELSADKSPAFPVYASLIAANRASRQVANKAEVGGKIMPAKLSYDMWRAWEGISNCLSADQMGEIYDAMYEVTPPATTGASTARDQAIAEALHAIGGVLWEFENNKIGMENEVYGAERCKEAVRALFGKGSIGASTVLTDERILQIARECAIDEVTDERRPDMATIIDFAREVAAQAGQVAVPGHPTEEMLNAARDWSLKKYGQGIGNDAAIGRWKAMLAAAPSPAKESK